MNLVSTRIFYNKRNSTIYDEFYQGNLLIDMEFLIRTAIKVLVTFLLEYNPLRQ